jgi:hypothetical protein
LALAAGDASAATAWAARRAAVLYWPTSAAAFASAIADWPAFSGAPLAD